MSDPIKQGEPITTPTEEEQETVTGGSAAPGHGRHGGIDIDPEKLHRHIRPKWDPGGPPQGTP